MMLHNEDRELQIELARLQMHFQYMLSSLFGLLAIEVSFFGIVYALYFTISGELKLWVLLVLVGLLVPIMFTISYFGKKLRQIEKETKNLRRKYVW